MVERKPTWSLLPRVGKSMSGSSETGEQGERSLFSIHWTHLYQKFPTLSLSYPVSYFEPHSHPNWSNCIWRILLLTCYDNMEGHTYLKQRQYIGLEEFLPFSLFWFQRSLSIESDYILMLQAKKQSVLVFFTLMR